MVHPFPMTSKIDIDPNAPADLSDGIFGLPFSGKDAFLHLIPVPWEATTSYGGGTSKGPEAILEASAQVDLYHLKVQRPYEPGIFMHPIPKKILTWNQRAKLLVKQARKRPSKKTLDAANNIGHALNDWVKGEAEKILSQGKIVGLIGGDHSTPFGAIEAIAKREGELGILHFDAHLDTRNAYEGFTWSHASIMRNVVDRIPYVQKLVQVGIRDFCEEEKDYSEKHGAKIHVHYDRVLRGAMLSGSSWKSLCERIVKDLPKKVYISFDIDGLDPKLCPGTGTPVPGGLEFHEATFLIEELVRSGRKIVGFDLNEVSPQKGNEWDANVGARMLYELCAWTLASQGKAKLS